jgi:cell division protein FtsW
VLFAWGVMYFVAGAPMLLLVGMAGAWCRGHLRLQNSEHFARRIDGFLSPRSTPPPSSAMPPTRSARAASSASGVGEGTVKWSLPDAHTDFIIAVAAEEYGLVLVLVIIALYARSCAQRSRG